jgi:hypothetical protein
MAGTMQGLTVITLMLLATTPLRAAQVAGSLVAGRPGGSSRLNFNSSSDGATTVVVPSRSRVVMRFVNEDSLPHSAAIVARRVGGHR